jgi:hypothetical protein
MFPHDHVLIRCFPFFALKFSGCRIQSQFGMSITRRDDHDSERNEYMWQQRSVIRRIYEVNMNVIINGMRNRLSKPRRSIKENLTGCLQRYVVLGYERNRKYLKFKINNIVLQIIPRGQAFDFDFHHRTGEICPAKRRPPDWPRAPTFCRVNNFSSEQLLIWWKYQYYG